MKKFYFIIIFFSLLANAQNVPIPDSYFKAKVVDDPSININGDLEIQFTEASLVLNLDLYNANISSLDGIEYFTNIQYLGCSYNNLTNIDQVFNLNNLTELDCSNNNFTTLNFLGLNNLQTLYCNNYLCTSITFNGQLNLKNLYFGGPLTNVDLSSLIALETAKCEFGSINNINLGAINLKKLAVLSAIIGTFNASSMLSLEEFTCYGNVLTSLILGNLPQLKKLYCPGNQLTTLDISGLPNLEIFDCQDNQISQLNISGLSTLRQLTCYNNMMNTIITDVVNTSLQYLSCSFNNINTLNTSVLTGLIGLSCSDNLLTSLNLNNSPNLNVLDCRNNTLTEILIKNNSLETVVIFENNPNLVHICADAGQVTDIQNYLTSLGYTNCVVDSACNLSTTNPNAKLDFAIYPNPSNGRFTINYNNLDFNNLVNLSVIDLQGRMVYDKENAITQEKTEINLENVLQSGVYFVKLYSNNFEKSIKIVVD